MRGKPAKPDDALPGNDAGISADGHGARSPQNRRPRRPRRWLKIAAIAALAVSAACAGLVLWVCSDAFAALMQRRIAGALETSTGGRVEIASFHWRPFRLEAEASGIVLHGAEDRTDAPYAAIGRLRAEVAIEGMWSPRIHLRALEIDRPAVHFISYPDGSTNQPHPAHRASSGGSGIDRLFDLEARNVQVRDGLILVDDRTDAMHLRLLSLPVHFEARDVSVRLVWAPAAGSNPESYRIDAGAADMRLANGKPRTYHGEFQTTIDLTRTALFLRSLRIRSRERGRPDRTLDAAGDLRFAAGLEWHAKVQGEFDMRLFDPLLDFPNVPAGTMRVDIETAGDGGEFRADGKAHVEDGAFEMPGVDLHGLRVDTLVHIDPRQMIFSSVAARFPQGGEIDGAFTLSPWLSSVPGVPSLAPAGSPSRPKRAGRNVPSLPYEPPFIPYNGKIEAQAKNLSLDTVLDAVSYPPFRRLGIDARIDGPLQASFTGGYAATTLVSAKLNIGPTDRPALGELPVSGEFDGTYSHRDGAVALRKLVVQFPSSQVSASGLLGVHPMSRSTGIDVDFHSGNLADFDALLRDLGVERDGRLGTAALPIALGGQAEFHGRWSGSILDPQIAGSVKTEQIAIEMLPAKASAALAGAAVAPRSVHWDSMQATGSYSAQRIAIAHAVLSRGPAQVSLQGSLDAAPPAGKAVAPSFDGNSQLHFQLRATRVPIDDLLPLLGKSAPVTGMLDTVLRADGRVNALSGAGSADLTSAEIYGEPVSRVHAEGALAGNLLNIAALSAVSPAGSVTASGSLDLNSRRFQVEGKSENIDISKLRSIPRGISQIAGRLGFVLTGSGTESNPEFRIHSEVSGLAIGGLAGNSQSPGTLRIDASAAAGAVVYDAAAAMEGADLKLHGRTGFGEGHATKARLEFSGVNIAVPLKLASLRALDGDSSLAGAVTIEGPLDRPDELRGEASLPQAAATLDGVHLVSRNGLHASLAAGKLVLDPIHITAEETDLEAQGSLNMGGDHRLDLCANGSINLKLAESLDSDLTAGGTSTFKVEAHGPLANPGFEGSVAFHNGSLSLEDIPNGLSQLNGDFEFNQNRLEVRSLTAMTGGGQLSVGGYLAYRRGLFADLTVTGRSMRIRYPEGVSSVADTSLRLEGSQNSLLLSGDVLITRFSVNPDFDLAALAAQANLVKAVAPPDAPSNHIRLDVHVASSPQLNFQNAFAKLAGNVDLHLRGTVALPSLLGSIAITEGSALLAGTRYDLQRGEISFTNPVRIEPTIDLNATARAQDYDITLGLHGTPQKLNVSYRSEPPLPEADVVALLALGRTGDQQRLYTQQQEQENSGPATDALLGGALNATVSSRVQKLFGAGSVKVDPNYLGALGNSTSRVIVEEQLGRNVTLTYATNVNTTGQQLVQAEVAINRHVSVLVARDESGVFSMVVKATRRYR